jgi:hypothetical protein
MVDGRPLGDTVQNCVGDNEEQKSKQGSINKNHGDNFLLKIRRREIIAAVPNVAVSTNNM